MDSTSLTEKRGSSLTHAQWSLRPLILRGSTGIDIKIADYLCIAGVCAYTIAIDLLPQNLLHYHINKLCNGTHSCILNSFWVVQQTYMSCRLGINRYA